MSAFPILIKLTGLDGNPIVFNALQICSIYNDEEITYGPCTTVTTMGDEFTVQVRETVERVRVAIENAKVDEYCNLPPFPTKDWLAIIGRASEAKTPAVDFLKEGGGS